MHQAANEEQQQQQTEQVTEPSRKDPVIDEDRLIAESLTMEVNNG